MKQYKHLATRAHSIFIFFNFVLSIIHDSRWNREVGATLAPLQE